ncbi:MAG TPA: methyltransferase domain-containing protein [Actinomycetota bacterium]|nr:methyltransferase domain-containing protein [Actinomycetota bacterium]
MSLDAARETSRAIWDEMSAGWELKSDFLWEAGRKIGEWMVEKVDPKGGQTILELAAGPGMTGFVAAKLVGDDGKLISTDFAPAMVKVAEKTAARLGVTNAEFRVMDAEAIDLPDASVDGVLCRWGLMLMMDPQTALKEIRRVLKPGGKLAFSVWGAARDNIWAIIAGRVMVSLGKLTPPDPQAPGGMFSMAEPSVVEGMMGDAGFVDWKIEPVSAEWRFADFDDYWSFSRAIAGAIALLLRDMDEAELIEVREAVRAEIEAFRDGDGYLLTGVAINAVATAPS